MVDITRDKFEDVNSIFDKIEDLQMETIDLANKFEELLKELNEIRNILLFVGVKTGCFEKVLEDVEKTDEISCEAKE